MKNRALTLCICASFLLLAAPAMAQSWGLWEADRSWIGLGDGEATDWYSFWDDGVGTFQGADLGTKQENGNYQIWNWDIKSWGANAGGAAMWVTIYPQGNRPASPTFEEWWQTNSEVISGEDRIWRGYVDGGSQGGNAFQVNILDGLAPGTYTLEIYNRMWGTDPAEVYDSNLGNNFTADFTVIPEPGSIMFILASIAGVGLIRRRMN